jgi:hypothetical protein
MSEDHQKFEKDITLKIYQNVVGVHIVIDGVCHFTCKAGFKIKLAGIDMTLEDIGRRFYIYNNFKKKGYFKEREDGLIVFKDGV